MMIDEPAAQRLLQRDEPGTDAPMEGADRNAHQAEDDEQAFPRFWRRARDMHDFMIGRARRQADRVAKALATAAHVAVGTAAHGLDRDERRAIDRPHPGIAGLTRQGPGVLVTRKCTEASLASKPKTPLTGQ